MAYQTPMRVRLDSGMNKKLTTAYILWFILGLIGGHQFYLGRVGRGVVYLLTAGLVGIGWIADGFTLRNQVRRVNLYGP
jgi:TM2 domain-containing membrane protein YozV